LDGVYNDVQDLDGFAAETLQARHLGFDGKTLIHPRQIEPCNRIFTPAAEDVDRARRILEAFDQATSQGRGVVTVDGRMIENLHVEEARRLLALADAVTSR
jgi:citrate lyase subunit beta/citryl-CoA lyase